MLWTIVHIQRDFFGVLKHIFSVIMVFHLKCLQINSFEVVETTIGLRTTLKSNIWVVYFIEAIVMDE